MINRWHAAGILFHHWLLKEDSHSIHSPALYRIYHEVFYPKIPSGKSPEAQEIRAQLKTDSRLVPAIDFGTKPSTSDSSRTIASVLKHEVSSMETAEMLGRLVRFRKAKRILEIGTCLGLTSLHLSAQPETELVTLEGNPFLIEIALDTFNKAGRTNIRLVQGNADDTLPQILADGFRPDLVVIDANHRFEPTLRYLRQIRDHAADGLTLVIDDIHYSPGMTAAWRMAAKLFSGRLIIELGERGVILTDVDGHDHMAYW